MDSNKKNSKLGKVNGIEVDRIQTTTVKRRAFRSIRARVEDVRDTGPRETRPAANPTITVHIHTVLTIETGTFQPYTQYLYQIMFDFECQNGWVAPYRMQLYHFCEIFF